MSLPYKAVFSEVFLLLENSGFLCGGEEPCMGNLSLLTIVLLFFLLKGQTEKVFMGPVGSVHCNLIVIYFFEVIHQIPHVGLDLVISV